MVLKCDSLKLNNLELNFIDKTETIQFESDKLTKKFRKIKMKQQFLDKFNYKIMLQSTIYTTSTINIIRNKQKIQQ